MQRFPCTRFVPVCKQIINLLEKFIESPYVLCVFLEFCGAIILDKPNGESYYFVQGEHTMDILSQPHFHNEKAAFAKLESIVWPDGPVCPHCSNRERIYDLQKTRIGLRKCGKCRKQFTVRVGTVFESSHVPLRKWFQAAFLMCSSKKGISSNQLHRTLGVTLKTAWFMAHRLREAMKPDSDIPFGGEGMNVEVDETYLGAPKRQYKSRFVNERGWVQTKGPLLDKAKIVTLVERGGRARSFTVDSVNTKALNDIMFGNIDRKSTLQTDEGTWYKDGGREFAKHETVKHSTEEYVRGDAHTNSIEGYFSIFKRGMKGIYQHCKERHLPRYLSEFDFRYSEREALGVGDVERLEKALYGIRGKRLTYQTTYRPA